MDKTCVVDFDKTLLKVDSIGFLLKHEHLYLVPSIFLWGTILFFAKIILPRSRQIFIRRKLKFAILQELLARGEQQMLEKYTPVLASYIDDALAQQIQREYSRVIVVSSSWQPLIMSVLRHRQLESFAVRGTVLQKQFSDFFPCWYTNKISVINQLHLEHFDLYTDSRDDTPLAERADRVVWVHHRMPWGYATKVLLAILVLAALVRLCGVGFGLPFWVVGDEPSTIFAALKMMQLKTVIPSLHVSEFVGNFYYGPYLPYLYLIPFAIATGVSSLFFSGSFVQLTALLTVNPSLFFVIARLISICFGTATVGLVYVWVKQMTKVERPALWSSLLLALSLMHINFSLWARHWVVAGFLMALVGCVLSSSIPLRKRYLLSALLIGLGMGVSIQAGIIVCYVALWALFVDRISLRRVWKEAWVWQSIGLGGILVAIAYALWPYAFGFLYASGGMRTLTLSGISHHISQHVTNLFITEPLLSVFAIIGMIVWFQLYRRIGTVLAFFVVVYTSALYVIVGSNGRFIMMLYPLLAVLAGVGASYLYDVIARVSKNGAIGFASIVVISLLLVAFRFDYLLLKNDTRVQARDWLLTHTSAETTMIIAVPLMRLETTPEYIEVQRTIDPTSTRTFEQALEILPDTLFERRFRALNLYSVESQHWYQAFTTYMEQLRTDYIVSNREMLESRGMHEPLLGTLIQTFGGMEKDTEDQERLPNGFGAGLKDLFITQNLGPTIVIHALK